MTVRWLVLAACVPLLAPSGVCLCSTGLECCAPVSAVDAAAPHDACSEDDSPSVPHEDHSHHCPAANLEAAPAIKPVAVVTFDVARAVVILFTISIVDLTVADRPKELSPPIHQPLYLSHCALLL